MAIKEDEILRREQAILDEIIQYYMDRHEAISARTLSKISRLALSPTTIRNLMEDLSAEGLLTTEGATRGRIPTQKAFAIYVTRLGGRRTPVKVQPPEIEPLEEGRPARLHAVVSEMGRFLAEQTGCVVLAALPERDRYPLDWVRFAALPRRRVLVTMQTVFGDLWSKVLVAADPFPEELARDVSRFINETYRGRPLESIRSDIMAGEPKALLASMPSLGAAFRMLRRAFEWDDEPDRPVWGLDNLYRIPEFQAPETLLQLHGAIHDPGFLASTQENGRRIDRGWISLGTETGYPGLEQGAVVGFPFGWGGWRALLGLLGPMRMRYAQVHGLAARCAAGIEQHLATTAGEAGYHGGGR